MNVLYTFNMLGLQICAQSHSFKGTQISKTSHIFPRIFWYGEQIGDFLLRCFF